MRVSFVPKITNYIGSPIIREVGVIRPPADFFDLISTFCSSSKLTMEVDGQQEKHEVLFRGPFGIIRRLSDKKVLRTVDLTRLHVFITEKDKPKMLRVQDEQIPESVVTFVFADMRERDMAHVKLGTWMSYWETLKTNRVNSAERRGFR